MNYDYMPYMFEYAPGKMFNMKQLITIEVNEHDPSSYLYGFNGPTIINVPKNAHERFMKILKHELVGEE